MEPKRARGHRGPNRILSEAPLWERIAFPVFWIGLIYMFVMALTRWIR